MTSSSTAAPEQAARPDDADAAAGYHLDRTGKRVFAGLMLAFVLSLFFKAPPLRTRSALQEQADEAGVSETGTIRVQSA